MNSRDIAYQIRQKWRRKITENIQKKARSIIPHTNLLREENLPSMSSLGNTHDLSLKRLKELQTHRACYLELLGEKLADSEAVLTLINEEIRDRDFLYHMEDDLGDSIRVWQVRIDLYIEEDELDE
jgi:hypothetical protein